MNIREEDLAAALACMQVTQGILLDVIEELLTEILSPEADPLQSRFDVAKEALSFLINVDCFNRLYEEIKEKELIEALEESSVDLKKRFKELKKRAEALGVEIHEIRAEAADNN